jgi:hypothetical protein
MRIGIDCSLVPGERVGIGQYSYQLVRALSRIDQANTYQLYPVLAARPAAPARPVVYPRVVAGEGRRGAQ